MDIVDIDSREDDEVNEDQEQKKDLKPTIIRFRKSELLEEKLDESEPAGDLYS